MQGSKRGFTLIELVVVIAILGILAAIAIPKYVDLTKQARKAADDGLLGGLRASTVMLYSTNIIAGRTNGVVTNGYWPTFLQVSNNMTDVMSWRYYTSYAYNITTGVWTVNYAGP